MQQALPVHKQAQHVQQQLPQVTHAHPAAKSELDVSTTGRASDSSGKGGRAPQASQDDFATQPNEAQPGLLQANHAAPQDQLPAAVAPSTSAANTPIATSPVTQSAPAACAIDVSDTSTAVAPNFLDADTTSHGSVQSGWGSVRSKLLCCPLTQVSLPIHNAMLACQCMLA